MWAFGIKFLIINVCVRGLMSYGYRQACDGPTLTINGLVVPTDTKKPIFVEFGKDLRILCTGSDSKHLEITSGIDDDIAEFMKTTILNETTISYYESKPPKMSPRYFCSESSKPCGTTAIVIVDTPPEVTDFRCKSPNFKLLNCTWISSNVSPLFTLFAVKEQPKALCERKGGTDPENTLSTVCNTSYYCIWYARTSPLYDPREETLPFILQACNVIGCRNTTFNIDHYSVLQIDHPKDIAVSNVSSYSAILKWTISYMSWQYISKSGLDHKVDYWFSGGNRTIVNASSLPSGHLNYELQLNLPCAGKYYEVRVSAKPKRATEEFWSDFTAIGVLTKEDIHKPKAANRICKTQLTLSPEVMKYKIDKLRRKVENSLKKLKRKIHHLKDKTIIISGP